MKRTVSALSFLATLLMLVGGCGPSGPTFVDVKGTVTFEGTPVSEGTISFEDNASGKGGIATIIAGTFTTKMEPGTYKAIVTPPTEEVTYENSPSDTVFKKVSDIPEKYWTMEKSDLAVTVGNEPENKVSVELHK